MNNKIYVILILVGLGLIVSSITYPYLVSPPPEIVPKDDCMCNDPDCYRYDLGCAYLIDLIDWVHQDSIDELEKCRDRYYHELYGEEEGETHCEYVREMAILLIELDKKMLGEE